MSCCTFQKANVDSFTTTDCRLTFLDSGGDVIYQMDLDSLVFYFTANHLVLQDAFGLVNFTLAEATTLGLTSAVLSAAQSSCAAGSAGGDLTVGIQDATSGTVTLAEDTYHSIEIIVVSTTATDSVDINSVNYVAGQRFYVEGDPGKNNITTDIVIDNFTGSTPKVIIVTTNY